MTDAKMTQLHVTADLPASTLRARAQRRRDTAERLCDDRLERLLLEEADELDARAAALESGTMLDMQEAKLPSTAIVQPDLAALREEP